jgi:hypothetical protein
VRPLLLCVVCVCGSQGGARVTDTHTSATQQETSTLLHPPTRTNNNENTHHADPTQLPKNIEMRGLALEKQVRVDMDVDVDVSVDRF